MLGGPKLLAKVPSEVGWLSDIREFTELWPRIILGGGGAVALPTPLTLRGMCEIAGMVFQLH